MTRTAIELWGTEIGMLQLDDNERIASFEYTENFIQSGIQIAPLTMPLSRMVYRFPTLSYDTFKGLPGIFADSLPDKFGNDVINEWLRSQGRPIDSLNALERLCYTGKRGMGALEYKPQMGGVPSQSQKLQVEELVGLASQVLDARKRLDTVLSTQITDELLKIVQVGTSAGGARAKALIAWNPITNEVRSGQIKAPEEFSYWLIKFDGISSNGDHGLVDPQGYGKIEYAYYLMARDANITISECRLFEEHGRNHFMTKRFDRTDSGNKLHMASLGGLKHYDYNDTGVNSYEDAVACIYNLGLGTIVAEELFRRMAFNIVTRNQDDHVKNISFLMDRTGAWNLAPAYDITFSYRPDGEWVHHQMSMNGKRDGFTQEDFKTCANNMRLPRGAYRRILEEVELAASHWLDHAASAEVPQQTAEIIKKQFRHFLV